MKEKYWIIWGRILSVLIFAMWLERISLMIYFNPGYLFSMNRWSVLLMLPWTGVHLFFLCPLVHFSFKKKKE